MTRRSWTTLALDAAGRVHGGRHSDLLGRRGRSNDRHQPDAESAGSNAIWFERRLYAGDPTVAVGSQLHFTNTEASRTQRRISGAYTRSSPPAPRSSRARRRRAALTSRADSPAAPCRRAHRRKRSPPIGQAPTSSAASSITERRCGRRSLRSNIAAAGLRCCSSCWRARRRVRFRSSRNATT